LRRAGAVAAGVIPVTGLVVCNAGGGWQTGPRALRARESRRTIEAAG